MIGEQEQERPLIGTTATVQANVRDSINYSTITERRLVVSKEQIMALPNLVGYWKYGDAVVRFRIEPEDRPQVAHAFMPRKRLTLVHKEAKELPPPRPLLTAVQTEPQPSSNGNCHDGKRSEEIVAEDSDDLDIT